MSVCPAKVVFAWVLRSKFVPVFRFLVNCVRHCIVFVSGWLPWSLRFWSCLLGLLRAIPGLRFSRVLARGRFAWWGCDRLLVGQRSWSCRLGRFRAFPGLGFIWAFRAC